MSGLTAAPDRSIHLAFFVTSPGPELYYARETGTALTEEPVGAGLSGTFPSIAVAGDSTVHIAFVDDGGVAWHATRAPGSGAWEVSMVTTDAARAFVGVDAAGAPHLVVATEDPTLHTRALVHATRAGASYALETIEGVAPVADALAFAASPEGAIALVARVGVSDLALLELRDGRFVRDATVPALADQPGSLALTVAPDGRLAVAVVTGHYTLLTGSAVVLLSREGGTWTTETLERPTAWQPTQDLAIAAGPTGSLHLFFFSYGAEALLYTRAGSVVDLRLVPDCEEGTVLAAVDRDDQPHVLYACDRGDAQYYLAPLERYPDAYVEACVAGPDLLCDRACECGGSECCYSDGTTDSGGCNFGPGDAGHDICASNWQRFLCGDVTRDTAPMMTCLADLEASGAMCLESHYVVPASCYELRRMSF
jgi:hypothetical protein